MTPQDLDKRIDDFIDFYQKDKQGIYPYQVAREVRERFLVTMKRATDAVARHIRKELEKTS